MRKNAACMIALTLTFLLISTTLFTGWVQADTQEHREPVPFIKFTPITLSAYLSPWSTTLDWSESVDATEYEYCFDKTDDDTCDDSWISTGMNTSVEITFLDANTTYYWQARAFDGDIHTEADGGIWWSFTTGGYARFHVETVENRVAGADWRPGSSVTVTVDDLANGIGVDFTSTKTVDPYGFVFFQSPPGFQLGAGMVVTMNDGVIFKSHTTISLQVTSVNVDTDTVSGTGTVGVTVSAQHCQYNGCLWRRKTTVQSDGTWQVDFSIKGSSGDEQEILDIVPGTTGEALYYDDDADHTDASWYIYQRIDAHPDEDRVDGSGWIVDSTVTIDIYETSSRSVPDYTNTATVIVNPGDPNSTYFNLDTSGEFDLQPGNIVTVSDGTTTKTHTITNPQILMANSATDEISGIAAPNSYVDLETCGLHSCHFRTALADSNGYWSVNFGVVGDQAWEQTIFDIQPGTNGNLRQWDNDIDTTMIQWTASDYVFLPLIVH